MSADASSRPTGTGEDGDIRLALILQQAVARRLTGEDLPDEVIIREHRDLMPVLGQRLSQLRAVEAARRRAECSSENPALPFRIDLGTETSARVARGVDDFSAATNALPGYEILRELHRGGQGVVYLAHQKSTRRQVAIKVMREGPFAGARERARFEQEVHILAQLHHPHIVGIHDSGTTAGHYYFVMDHVEGKRLDQWAADFAAASRSGVRPSALNQILELFACICDAVNAAHLRGIIHRDLKPGNILVVEEDAAHHKGVHSPQNSVRPADSSRTMPVPAPVVRQAASSAASITATPRILDFGLAKRTTASAAGAGETVEQTMAGQFVGSLPWASPEQVTGAVDRLDVRADVYSLGVIGFGLVTGGLFPYDVQGHLPDVVRNILHAEPRRVRSINQSVSLDVETILQTCLEKDPARRYQSAGELAREIRRYLAGEPIEARRGSGWYVLTRWLRRHWAAAAVAASFIVVITISAIALSFMYAEQLQLSTEAGQQAQVALRESERARQESARAQREANKARHTTEFLRDMLAAVDPNRARGHEPTIREVLDSAAVQVKDQFGDEPDVAAAIRRTIGQTYIALGHFAEAEAQYRAALDLGHDELGAEHPDTLEALNGLATALELQSQNEEAEALYRQCLELTRRVKGEDDPATIDVLHNLANFLRNVGRLDEAEPLLRAALELSTRVQGHEDSGTLLSKKILAALWMDQAKYDQAEPALREVLEAQRRTLGDKSPLTIGTIQYLGMLLKAMGRLEEADPLYEEAMATSIEVLGEEHHDTLRLANSLGRLRVDQGRLDEAEALYRRTIDAQRRSLGEAHFDTLVTTNNLALLLQAQGRLDEAEPHARFVEAAGREKFGETHPGVLTWMHNLGILLSRQGKPADAEDLYRRTLEGRRTVFGERHPMTIVVMYNLAASLRDQNKLDEAEPMFLRAIELAREVLPEGHRDIPAYQAGYARCLALADRHGEAEVQMIAALELMEQTIGRAHQQTQELIAALVDILLAQGKQEEAERYRGMLAEPHESEAGGRGSTSAPADSSSK